MQIADPHILALYDNLVAFARFVKHGGQCAERQQLLQVLAKLHGEILSGYDNYRIALPEFEGMDFCFFGTVGGVIVGFRSEMIAMRLCLNEHSEYIAITYRGVTEEITESLKEVTA